MKKFIEFLKRLFGKEEEVQKVQEVQEVQEKPKERKESKSSYAKCVNTDTHVPKAKVPSYASNTRAERKGNDGEFLIKTVLTQLNPKLYKVYNDLLLEYNGHTFQIDHMVVSRMGIFVIETKNYNAILKGTEFQTNWTHITYKTKHQVYNPILQNHTHIESCAQLLNLDKSKFINLVAFVGEAKLDFTPETCTFVTQYTILETIQSYRKPIIELEEIKPIFKTLEQSKREGSEAREEHINKIKQAHGTKETKATNTKDKSKDKDASKDKQICPRCGSELVKREGKYGTFLGCSRFPKCRYTDSES